MLNVSMCVAEPASVEKQLCQLEMVPELFVGPVERGCDPESCLVVVDRLLRLMFVGIYFTEEAMAFTDPELIAFASGEIERPGYGIFCGIKLAIMVQQPSELSPRLGFSQFVIKPF